MTIVNKSEKVAAYIRVSTQEQKLHGISLDAQRDKLKDYADKHQLKIVEWYEDEGVSGRKLIKKRPELQRMIKDAQAGKFDRIIFIKLDRFFRSVAEYHECMKLISPVVWTATEEKYDLTTANGRAFVNMKITIAELEADQTGERIKLVNDYKVKSGQPIYGSRSMSIGFMVDSSSKVKKVVKNPRYSDLVTDFINHFLVHQSKRGSYMYVKNKYDVPITYRNIDTLLKDTKLYGSYRGNDNYCEPYIDKATYDKLQQINKKQIKKAQHKRVYLFTGLIKCPCCGRILSSNTTNVKSKSGVKEYISYKCNNHCINGNCDFNRTINEVRVESYLINNFNRVAGAYIENITIKDNYTELNSKSVQSQIDDINKEMKNLTIAFTKSRITESEYDKLYTQLEENLQDLKLSIDKPKNRNLSQYKELLAGEWINIYEALNKDNKRAFWRKYIQSIILDKDANIIDINFFD